MNFLGVVGACVGISAIAIFIFIKKQGNKDFKLKLPGVTIQQTMKHKDNDNDNDLGTPSWMHNNSDIN